MSAVVQHLASPGAARDPGIGSVIVLVDTASSSWTANGVITFPASPQALGQITVKDATGSAGAKPIVIFANGVSFEGSTTLAIPYGARAYVFSGSRWLAI
jgi:hypothetical protein